MLFAQNAVALEVEAGMEASHYVYVKLPNIMSTSITPCI